MMPPQFAIDAAIEAARESDCSNSRRGAVIFSTPSDFVYGRGWNGLPGASMCDEECNNTACGKRAIHAEQAAILATLQAFGFGRRPLDTLELLHVRVDGGRVMPSREPRCVPCAALALHVGLAGVWLYHKSGWRRYETRAFYELSRAAGDQ